MYILRRRNRYNTWILAQKLENYALIQGGSSVEQNLDPRQD